MNNLLTKYYIFFSGYDFQIKAEPTENTEIPLSSEVEKRTYRYTQHGYLTIHGWSEKFEKIKLCCLEVYLPVLEKTKSTLIVFSDQDTFKDLGKNEYFNMLHIDVKIHKSVATIKLPDGKDVSKSKIIFKGFLLFRKKLHA